MGSSGDHGEVQRLKALLALMVLDTPPDRAYDDITHMAANMCGTPIALISLIDDSRQWFKSRVGLPVTQTPRDLAFCAHAIQNAGQMMVVHDALQDTRFAHNDLVTGEPHIRFYAGAPIVTSDGHALGTLCVIDRIPRQLDDEQLDYLRLLAQQVVGLLERPGKGGVAAAPRWTTGPGAVP